MKLLFFKQPKSRHASEGILGLVERQIIKSDYDSILTCNRYRSKVFFPEGEYVIYVYQKKHMFEKDDYTYFINLGDMGLFLTYLLSLKNEYTLESILAQIKGINVRSYVQKGFFSSSQKNCIVTSKGGLLYIECKNVGSSHAGINETFDLPLYAEEFIKELPYENIDLNKLEKLPYSAQTISEEKPDWAKFCIRAGVKIGVAIIAGYLGSQIDCFDFFEDIDSPIDSNLTDFETNNMFDDFEMDLTDTNEFTNQADYSNISFGQKIHVEQIGGGLGNADLDLEKKPGTSHRWYVKQAGKIIAEIKSLSETFYVPGVGTCKITKS